MPFTGTTALDAIKYINEAAANNQKLTTAELLSITEKMPASVGTAKVKLTYSGGIRTDGNSLYAGDLAKAVAAKYGSDVGIINNTEIGKLLNNEIFQNTLEGSFSGTPTQKEAQLASVLNGTTADGSTRINSDSLFDKASAKYIATDDHVPITQIVDDYDKTRVWSATEVQSMLHSATPSIDGIHTSDYQAMFNKLAPSLGEASAYEAIATQMNTVAIGNMADHLAVVRDANQTLTDVSVKGNLFHGATLPDKLLPDTTEGLVHVSEWFKPDSENFIPKEKVVALEHVAEILGGSNAALLGKLGIAGSIVTGLYTLSQATDAYAAGDTAHATDLMGHFFAGQAGGIAGGLFGTQAAVLAAGALLTVAEVPAIVLAGLVIGAGLVTATYGAAAAEWLYDEVRELTTGNGALSHLITDMASYFQSLKFTPLVVDVHNDGLSLAALADGTHFDFNKDGYAEKGGWVAPSEAFLVKDKNANGVIDNVGEMFGADGGTTAYAKLAALDLNHDGKLTGSELASLKLWQDGNGNGVTDAGELKTLASLNITQIDVAKQAYTATNAGNTVDGFVNIKNASGAVISKAYDVAFAVNLVDSHYVGSDLTKNPTVTADSLLYPLSRGYGDVKSLHLAITENAALKTEMDTLTHLNIATDMTLVNQHINTMLTLWSHEEGVAANSRARLVNGSPINYVNGQTLGVIEKFVGENFVNINGQTTPDSIGSARLHNAYFSLAEHIKEAVLVQSVFKDIFAHSYYSFENGDVVMNDTLANILTRANAHEPTDAAQNKAYWGHIGGIVASHADQFALSENQVLAQVNAKAGFTVDYHTLTLTGSTGVDDFDGTTGSDTIYGLAGNDTLTGDNGNDSLSGGDGNDSISGDYGNDTVDGGIGNDSLRGGGNNDLVIGGAGNDSLDGGYDNDTLQGGIGIDLLTGGSGADRFEFTKGDIGAGTNADHITDFSIAQGDKIALLGYGLSAAGFVGTGAMHTGGVVEFGYMKVAAGNYTLIRIDSDNNGTSDQEIRLDGVQIDLHANDFVFMA